MTAEPHWAPEDHETAWWRGGVIYQIYPRSFADSNGDGTGDLAGIASRVDYLSWLGVSAVWICPFFRSPMVDGGYDISDYTAVDPVFGSVADFSRLAEILHSRDIRIIIDFVPNHSSDQHPWFTESRSGTASAKRDWYVWAPPAADGGPPNNWESYFGGSAWEYDDASAEYYLHTYHTRQPDLNWRNPQVRAAMADVVRFWLDRGADGIRVDVLWILGKDPRLLDNPLNPGWIKGQPYWHRQLRQYSEDQPESHEYARYIRSVVDEYPGTVMLGEVVLPADRAIAYYGASLDEAQLPLNFTLAELEDWTCGNLARVIDEYLAILPRGATPNWFLGNHDFERIASRIGAIHARLAHFMLLTLPGTPILYYGDELGLPNGVIPPALIRDPQAVGFPERSREAARTPMQWDDSPEMGFSAGAAWLPLSRPTPEFTVAAQREDNASHLTMVRRLIDMRRRYAALAMGGYTRHEVAAADVLCYRRALPGQADSFLVLLNFADKPAAVPDLVTSAARLELSTSPHVDADSVELGPGEGRLYRVSSADQA